MVDAVYDALVDTTADAMVEEPAPSVMYGLAKKWLSSNLTVMIASVNIHMVSAYNIHKLQWPMSEISTGTPLNIIVWIDLSYTTCVPTERLVRKINNLQWNCMPFGGMLPQGPTRFCLGFDTLHSTVCLRLWYVSRLRDYDTHHYSSHHNSSLLITT